LPEELAEKVVCSVFHILPQEGQPKHKSAYHGASEIVQDCKRLAESGWFLYLHYHTR